MYNSQKTMVSDLAMECSYIWTTECLFRRRTPGATLLAWDGPASPSLALRPSSEPVLTSPATSSGMICRSVPQMFFFFQAEDGIRDYKVTGVQTCALPI